MINTRFFLWAGMALLVGLSACSSGSAANNSIAPASERAAEPGSTVKPDESTALPVRAAALVIVGAAGAAAPSGNGLIINPDIKGQSFLVQVGDTFAVQIPTFPTEGFTWQPQDLDTNILAEVGDPVFTADSAAAGSGGVVTLEFKVVGPGATALNLIYAGPSINGVPSLYKNSFGVTIVAK